MADATRLTTHAASATGHHLAEAAYLDAHFTAMYPEYVDMVNGVGIQPGWTVLDAGCGGGGFLPLLAELVGPTGRLHALDLAEDNVAAVQQRTQAEELTCPVDVRQGSLLHLPYADQSIDAVWSANVVQYLTDAEFAQALHEWVRVLRPGGLLAIKEIDLTALYIGPMEPEWWWQLFKRVREPGGAGLNATLRTVHLPHDFRQAGFTDVHYRTVVCERRAPLKPAELAYFESIVPFWASMAEQTNPSPEQLTIWQRTFGDLDDPSHILHSPDFYFRESYGVVTGIRATAL